MGKITSEVQDVTPQMAEQWLTQNLDHQRPVQVSAVEYYRHQMLNSQWLRTGEPIIFGIDGDLLNGQHRLRAAMAAKYTLKEQVIVRGVDRDAFKAMDTGRKRTAADVLAIAGHSSGELRFSKTLAAAAGCGHLYKLGLSPIGGGRVIDSATAGLRKSAVTHMDILRFVEENSTIKSSVKLVMDKQGYDKLVVQSSVLAWVHYQCRKINAELADALVQAIVTGENLKPGSPFLVLRELLIEQQASRKRNPKVDIMAGFVKMWNAARDGKKIDKPSLVFKRDWDKFPRFR